MTDRVEQILDDWQKQIEKGERIIARRNYELFEVVFRDGCKCFNLLKEELESPRKQEILAVYLPRIRQIEHGWMELSQKLQVWMAEIKEQAQILREDVSFRRKISGAYGYMRKSGNALRVIR